MRRNTRCQDVGFGKSPNPFNVGGGNSGPQHDPSDCSITQQPPDLGNAAIGVAGAKLHNRTWITSSARPIGFDHLATAGLDLRPWLGGAAQFEPARRANPMESPRPAQSRAARSTRGPAGGGGMVLTRPSGHSIAPATAVGELPECSPLLACSLWHAAWSRPRPSRPRVSPDFLLF